MNTAVDSDDGHLRIDSVTGVPLDLPIAGPGGRSFAFIIDFHIRALVALAWWFAGWWLVLQNYEGSDAVPPGWIPVLWWLPATAFYVLYHPVLEILMGGRTPGKRWAGVRIVTTEGMVPGIGALLVRNLFRIVDSLPIMYVVGLVTTIVTKRSQRIGDLAAGTLLIYDEGAKPESLEDLSRAGGSTGLSTAQAELVHDLIDRWPTLDPEDRVKLAGSLLGRFDPVAYGAQGEMLNDASALAGLQRMLGGMR